MVLCSVVCYGLAARTVNHTIYLLKYLLGANLRHFVVNEGTNPLVECYACLGPWLVVARTGPGGRPHAEVICFSMVSRETSCELVVSLSPCINFGKTPPCCYSVIAFCSSVLILDFDINQAEAISFLSKFISVG